VTLNLTPLKTLEFIAIITGDTGNIGYSCDVRTINKEGEYINFIALLGS
jgi:hypothetical protein